MPKINLNNLIITKLSPNRYELKGKDRSVIIEYYKDSWILVKGKMSSESVIALGKEIEKLFAKD